MCSLECRCEEQIDDVLSQASSHRLVLLSLCPESLRQLAPMSSGREETFRSSSKTWMYWAVSELCQVLSILDETLELSSPFQVGENGGAGLIVFKALRLNSVVARLSLCKLPGQDSVCPQELGLGSIQRAWSVGGRNLLTQHVPAWILAFPWKNHMLLIQELTRLQVKVVSAGHCGG